MRKTKTLLVAHGSSDVSWGNTFQKMTESTREKYPDVSLAFMELSSPSIEDEIITGKAEGYQHFRVLPLFLAKGKHLKKDIPAMLLSYETSHEISTELLEPIGEHPLLAEAIRLIIEETAE